MADISVIIPVKNRATLLRKTLDNLLAQSKKPDEIIVIDDNSTDDFKLVIFDYITEATFVNNKGTGPGAARNLGLEIVTGKYIQFFDSDDLMTSQKLEKQFETLEKTGADWAYGPYVPAREENGKWIQADVVMQWSELPDDRSSTEWILRGWNMITQGCMFRKELIDKTPKWNESLITHEDYLYLFHLSLLNPKMVHVPDEGVIYRQHGQQSTDNQTVSQSRSQDKMEVLIEMNAKLPQIKADTLSKLLMKGRLAQNFNFYKNQGGDPRRYSGYVGLQEQYCQWLYRFYNKRQRQKTGTAWEPMHGVSNQKESFNRMIENL